MTDRGTKPAVVVIGGGIVGVSCASYLLRDGFRVTILDPEGAGNGTSKGNAGAISPGSCVPLAMPGVLSKIPKWLFDPEGPLSISPVYAPRALPWLARFALAARPQRIAPIADALRALHKQVFDCYAPLLKDASCEHLIRRTGNLVVYETEAAFNSSRNEWAMRSDRGARLQFLTGGEVREFEPNLSDRCQWGVVQLDHGFAADPHRLVCALAEGFQRGGGHFLKHRATGFRFNGARLTGVSTDGPDIAADYAVVAAGAWSKPLARLAGAKVPLEDQRGYHIQIANPEAVPRLPVLSSDYKVLATPMIDGLRIAGIVEIAGLAAPPNTSRAARLANLARRVFPALKAETYSQWMGHRPCTPDTLPIIGPSPAHPQIMLAFGHGHSGMTGGPVTGRLISDMITGRKPLIDVDPYRPKRFH